MMETTDYVRNARRSREEDVRAMLDASAAGEEFEGQDAEDAISELPLSIEWQRHVVITLSTGGPAEWIDATVEADGSFRAEFHAVWGSESSIQPLREGDALWELVARYIEY